MDSKQFKAVTFVNNATPLTLTESSTSKYFSNGELINDDFILIETRSATLNPVDLIAHGVATSYMPSKLPKGYGRDYSGKVVKVGSKIKDYQVGDYVCGMYLELLGPGTVSEYIYLNPSVHKGMGKFDPSKIDFNQASAWGLVFGTAFQALNNHVKLTADSKILVIGGNSSVGSVSIQLAKNYYHLKSENIIAVCSTRSSDYVKSIGASEIIDYTKCQDISTPILAQNVEFDLILDCIGSKQLFPHMISLIKDPKEYAYVTLWGDQKLKYGNITLLNTALSLLKPALFKLYSKFVTPSYRYIAEAVEPSEEWGKLGIKLVENGDIKIKIDHVYQLEEFEEAVKILEKGKANGKLIIEIKKD